MAQGIKQGILEAVSGLEPKMKGNEVAKEAAD